MADTTTTNLGLTKPEIGSHDGTWGDVLNTDLDSIDAAVRAITIKGADVASASTLNLSAATGSLVDITGTTTITAITLAAGSSALLRIATGGLTFTNGASLVVEGGRDFTAIAGDYLLAIGYASSVVRAIPLRQPLSRGYIGGGAISLNAVTPNTKIDIAALEWRDGTNSVNIVLSSDITADCGTTGANGLDTGALANNTWYHVFVIMKADGTAAGLISTSGTSPTMPSGYVYKRRLGSARTDGSAHFIPFVQQGDRFDWASPHATIVSGTLADTNAHTIGVQTPGGVKTEALLAVAGAISTSAAISRLYLSALDTTDVAASVQNFSMMFGQVAGVAFGSQVRVRTDTSSQVRIRTDNNTNMNYWVTTLGWIDRRGKDD